MKHADKMCVCNHVSLTSIPHFTSTLVVTSQKKQLFFQCLHPLRSNWWCGRGPTWTWVALTHTWDANTEQALISHDVTTKAVVKWGLIKDDTNLLRLFTYDMKCFFGFSLKTNFWVQNIASTSRLFCITWYWNAHSYMHFVIIYSQHISIMFKRLCSLLYW